MSVAMTSRAAPASEIPPEVGRFVERLGELDPGRRARLKRNAGDTLAESRGVLPLFYQILPPDVRPLDVEAYFLAATLFGLAPEPGGTGSLAETLAAVARSPGANRDG